MPHLYVAPWEWFIDSPTWAYWRAPGGDQLGSLDMRTIPAMNARGGVPQGFGLFTYSSQRVLPGAIYLGDDPTQDLSLIQRSALQTGWGMTFSETRLDRILAELHQAAGKWDASGETRWKPIASTLQQPFQVEVGGFGVIYAESSLTASSRAASIAVFQADYRRQKMLLPLDILRKWTGATMRDLYGRMGDDLLGILPSEYQGDGWAVPGSRIDDTFNRADGNLDGSTTSDGQGTWTEFLGTLWTVTGNAARETGGTGEIGARVNVDLATSNHRCGTTIKTMTFVSGNFIGGPHCRKDSTATETLYTAVLTDVAGTRKLALYKLIAGAPTQLGATGPAVAVNDVMQVQANGSAIAAFQNGVSKVAVTDTGITGNLRCGLTGNLGDSTNIIDLDDWYAIDLEGEFPAGHDKSRLNVLVRM